MIKIYNRFNEFVKQTANYKDLRVEKGINQSDLIFFTAPKQNAGLFEEEGCIEIKQGKFVIKEKNVNIDMQVVGKYDLTDLNKWVESKAYITMNIIEMFKDLLDGTGWTSVYDDTKTPIKRTVTATNMSILDVIKKAIEIFNYEIEFDNINKIIYVANELGSDKGVYFHDELNLRRLNISSDTYDFATRMIPRGLNGEGIEQINNGIPYVENHTYSDKIITVIWEDERYTVMDNLKEDAEKKLEILSKPRRSFTCDIANLASVSDEYSILDYSLGDTITLVKKESGTREKQRIMKLVHYPDNPLLDTIDIENRPRKLGDREEERIENLEGSNSVIKASLELLEDSVVSTVKRLENLVVNADNRLYQSQTNILFYFNSGDGEIIINRSAFHPYYKVTSNENMNLSINFPLSRYAENLIDKEVTISLDVMTELDSTATIEDKEYDLKANTWTRIHITKDFPATDTRHARVRTRYSKKQSRDIKLGDSLIDSLKADIDTLYYRNLQVQKGDIPTNWTLTPEELDAQIERYESEIKQLADEISLRVTSGELESAINILSNEISQRVTVGQLSTEVIQNAESWGLSINGELNGATYTFDGDNFTIGGTSGDTVEHDNQKSVYHHSDGSSTEISALGLYRYSGASGKEYHHLIKIIKFSAGADGQAPTIRWIPIGEEFNDTDFNTALSISDSIQASSDEATLHRIVLTQGVDSNNTPQQPRFRNGQWEYPVTGYTTYYSHTTNSRRYSDVAGIMIVIA